MSEQSFWQYLSGVMPPEAHCTRIESDSSPGFPDVHYTLPGGSGTIELKHADANGQKRPFSKKSGLRRSQRIWIRDELEAGGTVFLGLQYGRWVYILPGRYYLTLDKMTLAQIRGVASFEWTKGVTPVERIRNELRSTL